MIKSRKRGITLASLAIYLVLFTTFTVFVSMTSNSVQENLFDSRGEAINYSNLGKLQYNIENSALNSNDVIVTGNQISYSNGDNYIYDDQAGVIYKNGGVLCLNVDSFNAQIEASMSAKTVTINISFIKYLNTMQRTIISCVEGV